MQIDRNNFSELLPSIIQHINLADFIAFDCQFSGLITKLDRIQGLFPNHIQFYERIKQTAYNFRLLQLGITAFIFDGKNYIPKPYNFYISAATHTPTYNNVMICEVESMEFLANNNLDFGKVFKSGIKSSRLFSKDDPNQKHHNHPGPPLEHNNMFFCPEDKELVNEIENIIHPMKESPKLQKIINFKSKNILTYFKAKYNNLMTDKPKKNMDTYQYNVRMLKKLVDPDLINEEKQKEEEIIFKNCSLEKVIEAIIKGRKPIIGHFPNLDIGLIFHSFLGDLPDTYEEFCYQINQCFPYILDTKVLSRRIQSKLKGLKVDLSSLFKACFNEKLLQKYTNIDFQSSKQYLWKEHCHEAGYDSFITGCAFVGMANYMVQSSERINFQTLQNENKLLYSRFAGQVSINGNMLCPSAMEYESKILIQKVTKQENPAWRQHAEILSQYGNLSVYEDHSEIYYVYESIRNIPQIIQLLPNLKLQNYSSRRIIRARNMYKLENQDFTLNEMSKKLKQIDCQ